MATRVFPARSETARNTVAGEQCVVLRDVGWKGYQALLDLRGERSIPRLLYLDGTVWLMSPSFPHEFVKERLGWFVVEVVAGLRIPCTPSGATTFRREDEDSGVEPDQSYYLASSERIRGKRELSLPANPPPDLAIEVVHTNPADRAIEIHRRLGVPEVWVWEDDELRILVLDGDHQYAPATVSRAFPFVSSDEVTDWIGRPQGDSETDWVLALRDWVARVLRPRHRPVEGGA
jgi:Uma2 family endonuclease